jgi:hypothetical protein
MKAHDNQQWSAIENLLETNQEAFQKLDSLHATKAQLQQIVTARCLEPRGHPRPNTFGMQSFSALYAPIEITPSEAWPIAEQSVLFNEEKRAHSAHDRWIKSPFVYSSGIIDMNPQEDGIHINITTYESSYKQHTVRFECPLEKGAERIDLMSAIDAEINRAEAQIAQALETTTKESVFQIAKGDKAHLEKNLEIMQIEKDLDAAKQGKDPEKHLDLFCEYETKKYLLEQGRGNVSAEYVGSAQEYLHLRGHHGIEVGSLQIAVLSYKNCGSGDFRTWDTVYSLDEEGLLDESLGHGYAPKVLYEQVAEICWSTGQPLHPLSEQELDEIRTEQLAETEEQILAQLYQERPTR